MTKKRAHIQIPNQAIKALDILEAAGHEAWIVGGFVRDSIMNRPVGDLDIATSSYWQETQKAFEAAGCPTFETGIKHGTLTVNVDGEIIEITTYRTDGSYSDGRHPDQVMFVNSIEEDLARRDFTMNAIAYHPQRGILDPYGGQRDIENKVICTVGDPNRRFSEDALRIIRAARFNAQLGFEIETETRKSMDEFAPCLMNIAVERQMREWNKLLCGSFAGKSIMENFKVLGATIPEVLPMQGFDQRTPFHCYDVLEHTAHVVDLVEATPLQRWAALLHDIGKPDTFTIDAEGQGHFKGHPARSAEIAKNITKRLKMESRLSRDVITLVSLHDSPIIPNEIGVKKALKNLGDPELVRSLCILKLADATARTKLYGRPRVETARRLLELLDHILQDKQPYKMSDLAINGSDIISAGINPGPQVGKILDAALDAVIEGLIPNSKEGLIAFALQKHDEP